MRLQKSALVEDVQIEGISLPFGDKKAGFRGHYGLQFVRTKMHLVCLRSEIAERAIINLVSFAMVINPLNRVNAHLAKNINGCFQSIRSSHGKPENAGIDVVANVTFLKKKKK